MNVQTSLERLWEATVQEKIPLVLWGAGERGEYYLSLLKLAGIEPACFGDMNPDKTTGDIYFKGLPIYSGPAILEKFDRVTIMVTVQRISCANALNMIERLFGDSGSEVFLMDDGMELAMHTRFDMFRKRSRLLRRDFTILSNSCTAGDWYAYLGLVPNTPIQKCLIFPGHYVKLLSRLEEYLSMKLEFGRYSIHPTNAYNRNYPVAKLGDVELHFVHDQTFDLPLERWNKGLSRVNWDQLFVLFDDVHFPLSFRLAREFDELPFKNKVLLTRYDYPSLRSVCKYNPQKLWPVVLNHNSYVRYDRFDLIRWLNEGGQGSDFQMTSVMDDLPEDYVDWLYSGGMSLNYDLNDLMLRPVGGQKNLSLQSYI